MAIISNTSVGNTTFFEVDEIPTHLGALGDISIYKNLGRIYINTDGGTTWTDVTGIFPSGRDAQTGGLVVTEPLGDDVANLINPKDVAVYDCRFVLDYYRLTADKRLLFGGGANYSGRESRDIDAELRPAIEKTFPRLKGVKVDFQWSGMMGIVINRIPQLGKISDNVFYAQGYSGHGIALTHIVSEIMANAMTGQMKDYNTFANCKHIRLPGSEWIGNQFLALGMWYYLMLEKLR